MALKEAVADVRPVNIFFAGLTGVHTFFNLSYIKKDLLMKHLKDDVERRTTAPTGPFTPAGAGATASSSRTGSNEEPTASAPDQAASTSNRGNYFLSNA